MLAGIRYSIFDAFIKPELFDVLIDKKFLETSTDNEVDLTQKSYYVLDLYCTKTRTWRNKPSDKPKLIEVPEDLTERYRALFKGLKPGSMGYSKGVEQKLKRFFNENPETTADLVIKATERYLDSLTSYDFLQQADYFIYKRERNGEESSRLSTYIEEVKLNPKQVNDDWTSKIR